MRHDRDNLTILATARQERLHADSRPRFDLTAEEIERSTRTAMKLADASRSQVKSRAGADIILPE